MLRWMTLNEWRKKRKRRRRLKINQQQHQYLSVCLLTPAAALENLYLYLYSSYSQCQRATGAKERSFAQSFPNLFQPLYSTALIRFDKRKRERECCDGRKRRESISITEAEKVEVTGRQSLLHCTSADLVIRVLDGHNTQLTTQHSTGTESGHKVRVHCKHSFKRKVARPFTDAGHYSSSNIAYERTYKAMMPSYHKAKIPCHSWKTREIARRRCEFLINIAQMARRPMGRAQEKRLDRFTTITTTTGLENRYTSYQLGRSVDWVIGMLQATLVIIWARERGKPDASLLPDVTDNKLLSAIAAFRLLLSVFAAAIAVVSIER